MWLVTGAGSGIGAGVTTAAIKAGLRAGEIAWDAFGRLASANLTRGKGGIGGSYTDADYVRSIRYGVRPDGTPLIFMPSDAFYTFSDADLGAIIAYLKTVPPVDGPLPSRPRVGPLARAFFLLAGFPLLPVDRIPLDKPHLTAAPIGVTKEYGDYLVSAGGCKGCHNPNLSGGEKIGGVPSANLTPRGLGKWSEADFTKALRTGVRPDGRILSAAMPYDKTRFLTDDEIRAMWMYLQSLPPREIGK